MRYYLFHGFALLRKINIDVVIVFFPAKLSSSSPKLLRRLRSHMYLDMGDQTLIFLNIAATIVDHAAQVNCALLHG